MPEVPGAGLLSKKVGPLPGWGWAVLVGGVMGVYLYIRNRNAQPQISTGTDTATGETQAPTQTTGFGTLIPAVPVTVPNTYVTNEEWVQAALSAMAVADPVLDAAAAEVALNQYIKGGTLTPAQGAYVTLAKALIGAPPIPIGKVPSQPPVVTPPPAPTNLHIASRSKTLVHLAWTPVKGATGYGLYRNGGAISFPIVPAATVGNITATYTVKAHYGVGHYSAPSNALKVTKK